MSIYVPLLFKYRQQTSVFLKLVSTVIVCLDLQFFKKIFHKYKLFEMKRKLRIGTDCSGIEAPIQALQKKNISFLHLWSSDIDPMVRKSILGNYNPNILYENICERNHKTLPKIDLYFAGFPCQSFSTLGKRKGLNDERGNIFYECIQTISHSCPTVFILENVKGLMNHDQGRTFKHIQNVLSKLKVNGKKYNVYYKLLNTRNYNIPQNRERIYIVGILENHEKKPFEFPKPIPLKKKIKSFLEKKIPQTKLAKLKFLTNHKKNLLQSFFLKKNVESNHHWFLNLNVSSIQRTGARKDICPCLLAGEGGNCTFYLTSVGRKLTPREYLRLQWFSNNFKIVVPERFIYKQVGNSMSVNVLVHLFQSLEKSIKW